MANSYDGKKLKLWTPATYRIELDGEVGERFRDSFSGLRITTLQRKDQSTVTTLVGRMRDQAELTGLLNSLHDLHLPIISVQILSQENDTNITNQGFEKKEEEKK
ncbi:hypothetical protein [Desulfosarcina sp.]|uniref:hypothetical protein n=1 Tax=Desulfosarcina sp. TaxID=2027861 RepID=UPI0029A7E948|nr:hypothetical protein [Desulfosarcina sp.]MDX2454407.1 hypothetical protein [Desulfosarcina sp.]